MAYIQTNTNGEVTLIHNYPLDTVLGFGKTKDELLQEGYFVDNIPPADTLEGKCAVMMYNAETNNLYYEYIDALPTPKTELELLQEKVALQEQTILELSMMVSGGAV